MTDQQSAARWLETLNREKRAKEKWQAKYLTAEEASTLKAEEKAQADALAAAPPELRRINEQDAMIKRLEMYADDESAPAPAPPIASYELARQAVTKKVAETRMRSHRLTGDMTTDSLLKDIGPGMWTSVNPMYIPGMSKHYQATSHASHGYDPAKGWADRVDKTYHLKQDEFMAHADKCLQLGELLLQRLPSIVCLLIDAAA